MSLAAGIISAVVFASATTGAMLFRVVLFFLTPLSLYLAGLGLGTVAAAIAGITATTLVLLMANPLAAEVYAISTALPALVCTRLAVLSRDTAGEREWYPIGRIVAVAAIFAGVFAILALILLGGDVEALTKMLRSVVESFVKTEMSRLPGAPPITAADIDDDHALDAVVAAVGARPIGHGDNPFKSLACRSHHAGIRPVEASVARSRKLHDAGERHIRLAGGAGAIVRRRHDGAHGRWCCSTVRRSPSDSSG